MASKRHLAGAVAAIGGTVALVAAAPASAATTFGSTLSHHADLFISCGTPGDPLSQCTVAQTQLPAGETVVPSDGVIVRWRIRSGSRGAVRLRVLQPAGGGKFTAVESSASETVAGTDTVSTFPTRLPVVAGEVIGVDHERRAGALFHASSGAATLLTFDPLLADLESRAPTRTTSGSELLLNADVERDADGDGFGDETQDNCPSIANPDQSHNPCPSNSTSGGGGGGGEVEEPPANSRRFHRHRHVRHRRHLRGHYTGADTFQRHTR